MPTRILEKGKDRDKKKRSVRERVGVGDRMKLKETEEKKGLCIFEMTETENGKMPFDNR